LIEALDGFRADPLVGATLGEEFRDIYLRQKNKEWQRDFYRVTDEERSQMMEYI
jgi:glutamine synthetase